VFDRNDISNVDLVKLRRAGFDDVADKIFDAQSRYNDMVTKFAHSEIKYKTICHELRQCKQNLEDEKVKKFTRFNQEECWLFQDDGEDHLESLVAPVVVSPYKMQELLKARDEWLTMKTAPRATAQTTE
jgi:hypothetical protein